MILVGGQVVLIAAESPTVRELAFLVTSVVLSLYGLTLVILGERLRERHRSRLVFLVWLSIAGVAWLICGLLYQYLSRDILPAGWGLPGIFVHAASNIVLLARLIEAATARPSDEIIAEVAARIARKSAGT